jgi:cobalt ECF transporter T component CbiQ
MAARRRRGYAERTIDALLDVMGRASEAERRAGGPGLLQALDPRVKVAGLPALVVATALARNRWTLVSLLLLAVILAAASRLPFRLLVARLWLGTLVFTGAIALPALFITPGEVAARVPALGWTITHQGLTTASYLLLRVLSAATFGFLLVFTTPWTHVLKALRVFRVPVVAVVALGMTYRYILLLLHGAHALFEARRSRTVGRLSGPERRRIATAGAGVLLDRSLALSQDVYMAMQSRGFRGEMHLLDDFRMRRLDWLALGGFALLTLAAILAGLKLAGQP